MSASQIIEFFFSAALFINAMLFIPQSVKIIREKTAKSSSMITFFGLLLIQLTLVLHGFSVGDQLLAWGYVFSMVTTGAVVVLIIYYRFVRTVCAASNFTTAEIFEQLPGHIYWKDKGGRVMGCNMHNWINFGLQAIEEYVGKTDYDVLPKEEADKLRLVDSEVIRTGKITTMEEVSTTKEGKKASFLSCKAPLRDKKGDVVGIVGMSIDSTNTKQIMLDELEMLESIISVMPGNVYWMNQEGVYLGCNNNQAEAIGLASRKDIVGKRNVDLPGFLISEALDPINKKVMESGEAITLEEPAILRDGAQITVISSKVPIRNSRDEVVGMVGISLDITERKRQEKELLEAKAKAEESNEIKSNFISNMEHDIRTPFVGIYGMINFMAEQESDPTKKGLLSEVATCAKELMDYCDKILDFSKVESGDVALIAKRFVLKSVVDRVVGIEAAAAQVKNLALTAALDENMPEVLVGDPYRLERVLLNLASNAIKFTEEGSVSLTINQCSCDEEKRQVVLQITMKDTGMGIPDDKKALIYEKFSRVTPSNKGLYKGLGLGLKIVKQFVSEMGGEVNLASKVGEGTTFTLFIPFELPFSDQVYDD